MTQDLREHIRDQAEKIAKDCDRASIRDSLISANWYRWNLRLGIGAALLAGLSASLAGADFKGLITSETIRSYVQLGVLGLASVSAILTSIVTFLAPAERASVYHEYSNRYWGLRDRVRIFALIECSSSANVGQLKKTYERLLQERIVIDSKHPTVPEWVYQLAGKKLREKVERNKDPTTDATANSNEAPQLEGRRRVESDGPLGLVGKSGHGDRRTG